MANVPKEFVDYTFLNDKSKVLKVASDILKERRDCSSDEQFIVNCVDFITHASNITSLPEMVQSVKDLIKDSYPEHWDRIEKLLVLK